MKKTTAANNKAAKNKRKKNKKKGRKNKKQEAEENLLLERAVEEVQLRLDPWDQISPDESKKY